MHRRPRRSLLALICLLILSWGTCPCVISKAFAEAPESAEEIVEGCPCCQHKLAEGTCDADKTSGDTDEKPGLPPECPCCARSGANRPLPPAPVDVVLPPMSDDVSLWFPELATSSWEEPAIPGWGWGATGPPWDDLGGGRSNHGCPVGIVLLLN